MTGGPDGPIGVFDSGVGGLSILNAIRRQLPDEDLVFVADQAHVPYGRRTAADVRLFAYGITEFLLERGAKLVVVACNTASAAALYDLRQSHPQVLFVGMEPAVKPAAEHTRSGVVGVLATHATFQGALYTSVVDRFARDVTILQDTCVGLVDQIERGLLDDPSTRHILEAALEPMLAQRADTIVLGCTHYPFAIPLIKEIVGETVHVIDPAPAVARQVGRVLAANGLLRPAPAAGTSQQQIQIFTTGDPGALQRLLPQLASITERVSLARWRAGRLVSRKT